MKSLKAAAVLAGSIAVAGAATPAFAGDLTPSSLNGGVETLTSQGLLDPKPVGTNMLSPENKDSVVNAVNDVAKSVSGKGGPGKLLGGLPA
ncbi:MULTISPECIES: hypothetical protein [Streptomyces]|uniref:ATP-binding protein n=2 Tax=Streptomyces TaxID=1883 RepID=A0A0W7WZ49_9ACTN|nr:MULTISPECIES: hypothetical protein [Streptomyces]KUF15831.1 hypothetical protein AT728_14060 [Streptomyces silvensis]MVO88910.1 hypothetical protein [Streptomyces typhae]